jgi:hypothetical protein
VVVVPDGGGERENALQDPDQDALVAVAAVAFEAELGLEGGVDRFDDLAQGLELGAPRRGRSSRRAGRNSSMPWWARQASNSADA